VGEHQRSCLGATSGVMMLHYERMSNASPQLCVIFEAEGFAPHMIQVLRFRSTFWTACVLYYEHGTRQSKHARQSQGLTSGKLTSGVGCLRHRWVVHGKNEKSDVDRVDP